MNHFFYNLFNSVIIKQLMFLVLCSHGIDAQNNEIITDIDGNEYHSVKIGNQIWMAENLKVSRYRNGDTIPEIKDNAKWVNLKTGAFCNYNNDKNFEPIYGKLYNWYAVNDKRNIAPKGWHIPTNDEISVLAEYLGGYKVAGGKLKTEGTENWKSPNEGADNSIGFSALPGGTRFGTDGSFGGINEYALFWTASPNGEYSFKYSIDFDKTVLIHNYYYSYVGYSVRCIKD